MGKKIAFYFIVCALFLHVCNVSAQQKIFNLEKISDGTQQYQFIITIAQDNQGFMWFGSFTGGLMRYDGSTAFSITNNPQNPNSLASNRVEKILIDSNDIFWIGFYGAGLDRYDRAHNTFIHFRHNTKDAASLCSDTVTALLLDRSGKLWVGTHSGLDLMDTKTGTFTHYYNKRNDPASLSYNDVRVLYEDRQGVLWVGCGSAFTSDGGKPEDGGLNRFDKRTGKFTRYLHDPNNPNSIANNKVRALLEDSKGNFWVGTAGDGLHTLNKATGIFTHYYYDSAHPEKLSRPPIHSTAFALDYITFINEDAKGDIWIGSFYGGLNQYNPDSKKITHHGYVYEQNRLTHPDTLSGFKDAFAWNAFSSKEGLLWIATTTGNVYTVNRFGKPVLPYTEIHTLNANTFYKENNATLWIGTNNGLIRKDLKSGTEKFFLHDKTKNNLNRLDSNVINAIEPDNNGMLWLATFGGLYKYDSRKNEFTRYKKTNNHAFSISCDSINYLHFDQDKNLWISTQSSGLDKMNITTGAFSHFSHSDKDANSLSDNRVFSVAEDKTNIWAATPNGLNQLNKTTGKINHYLLNNSVVEVYIDASGKIWAGTERGLFYYDATKKEFVLFENTATQTAIVLDVIEDNHRNLWVSTAEGIFKIDEKRRNVRIYGANNGVHSNFFLFSNNYKTKEGELFLGDQAGYYNFYPDRIIENNYPPQITITSFQLGGKEILPGTQSIQHKPLYKSDKIVLAYNQNSFSIGFSIIDFFTPGERKCFYMLENYDNQWHEAGADLKAYFYNLPTANYVLRIKAVNSEGLSNEKTISIIISPPWWKTWWAITLFALFLTGIVWSYSYYRSRQLRRKNRLLEEKVSLRTHELQEEKEKVESTLSELKSAQAQLIQSEKMASLGELTAGIAHEIQNPLNFVNNFSEVNKELVDELKTELATGNQQQAIEIANDIKENEEKINHHGKRADAIVKGMLQHSRQTKGVKEPTDINALCDEYLRLSYHGLRAKDKSFNADFKTDFDESLSADEAGIGKINIVPQDIGRVLLNLFNNAFYAVCQKQQTVNIEHDAAQSQYVPTVTVVTKKVDNKVEIHVSDNGNGIPQNIIDKIFQPFFTTKPTGQGTGLGLSLAYDIIKAHGGEIKVESKEGEGAEFVIQLKYDNFLN